MEGIYYTNGTYLPLLTFDSCNPVSQLGTEQVGIDKFVLLSSHFPVPSLKLGSCMTMT